MPKKGQTGGFMTFMKEFRNREERENRRTFATIDDAIQAAGVEWTLLSPEDKEYYKEIGKGIRTSDNRPRRPTVRPAAVEKDPMMKLKEIEGGTTKPKPNVVQFTVDEIGPIFFEKDEVDKLVRHREKDRTDLNNALTWKYNNLPKDILNESFNIFAVENYYETPDHEYAPAEVAIIEFSLAKGITRQYVAFVKPSPISCCSKKLCEENFSAEKMSPENIPSDATDDYRAVVNSIKKVYEQNEGWGRINNNIFRIFTSINLLNEVQGASKALRDLTGSKTFLPYDKISCLEDLLILLYQFKEVPVSADDLIGFERSVVKNSPFDFDPKTLCMFHNKIQSKQCALATARKLCYHLFNCVKDLYELTITPKHIPILPSDLAMACNNKLPDEDDYDFWLCGPSQRKNVVPDTSKMEIAQEKSVAVENPIKKSFKNPTALPSTMLNLPGAEDLNDQWNSERDNVKNEVKTIVDSVATTKNKIREKLVSDDVANIKWEPSLVFSMELRKFVPVTEINDSVDDEDDGRYSNNEIGEGSDDDNILVEETNVLDEEDDLEAASYAASCSNGRQSLFAARPRHEENNIKLMASSSGRFNNFETEESFSTYRSVGRGRGRGRGDVSAQVPGGYGLKQQPFNRF